MIGNDTQEISWEDFIGIMEFLGMKVNYPNLGDLKITGLASLEGDNVELCVRGEYLSKILLSNVDIEINEFLIDLLEDGIFEKFASACKIGSSEEERIAEDYLELIRRIKRKYRY